MTPQWNRREVLKGLAAASASMVVSPMQAEVQESTASVGREFEAQITSVSPHTFRLSILPLDNESHGHPAAAQIPFDGSLIRESWGEALATFRSTRTKAELEPERTLVVASLRLKISIHPFSVSVANEQGEVILQLMRDDDSGVFTFQGGSGPLFGLGEGGQQFDRRGSTDLMRSGQGGYKLATHGGRKVSTCKFGSDPPARSIRRGVTRSGDDYG
jgi:alpha-glucosidase